MLTGLSGEAQSWQSDQPVPVTATSFEGLSSCGVEGSCGDCGMACGGCSPRLLGIFAPSDTCFSDFISPMTNPVNFEDPRTLTEARFIFANHRIPPALGGEGAQVFGLQARAALTDRLSVIATKNGFLTYDTALADDGWLDLALGVKLNLLKNHARRRLLSAGITYEIPCGTRRALQGNGDGEYHVFLTGAAQMGQWHLISGTGLRLASSNAESELWYWSNHIDRRLGNTCLYGLAEVNWYHWLSAGTNGIDGVEGLDLINLGSTGVAGNDIVTGAFGFKYKPNPALEVGVAWEVPITDRRDILDNRLTFDCILRY